MLIIVVFNGDVEQMAKSECATVDSILDTFGQELSTFASGWGMTVHIDDTIEESEQ